MTQPALYVVDTTAPTSHQVDWWSVHCHVDPLLRSVSLWPMAGTPTWHRLDDDDPVKLAALFDAARHWALRVDSCQDAMAQASQAISISEDWAAVAARKTATSPRISRRGEVA